MYMEPASAEKATGKRLLTQHPFEVCKKVKAEAAEIESPPNTEHLRFGNKVEELLAQVKNDDDMEQFKGTMGAFCEITNNFVTVIRKNAELYKDVEVAKKEVAAANDVAESAMKKAEESDNRALNAEKDLEDLKKAYDDLSEKAEDSGKRAEKAEKEMKIAFEAIAFGGFGKAFQDFSNAVTRAYEVAMLKKEQDP